MSVCYCLSISNSKKNEWKASGYIQWKSQINTSAKSCAITRPAVDWVWFDRTLFWVCSVRSAMLMHISQFDYVLCCSTVWTDTVVVVIYFMCRACQPACSLLMNNFSEILLHLVVFEYVNECVASAFVCQFFFLFILIDRNWQ